MKINETSKMATPIEERLDQNLKIRTGMVMVSDGKSKPEPMRLHLTMEMCTLQKQDLSTPTSSVCNTNNSINPPIESKVCATGIFVFVYYIDSINFNFIGTNGADNKTKIRWIGFEY